ncbi:MAG: hypothetical protein H6625_11420 [Bdellovibrionaceae bacterium]|nr:hypothetical protein [Pseudobdellovibrionaceae bacterium]
MKYAFLISIILSFLSLGCDSNPFNPSSVECKGESEDCKSQNSASSTVGNEQQDSNSNGSQNNGNQENNNSRSNGGTPISNTQGGGGSSNGSSSGTGSAGGFVEGTRPNSSSGSETRSSNNIKYNSPGGSTSYFSKINEPLDQQVEINLPFAFKFVAVGKMPLVYKWYKITPTGNTIQLDNSSTFFSKASATATDAGSYYATVEDSEGNILTSRRAQLIVNPERRNCNSGKFGPQFDTTKNTYDFRNLVPEALMQRKAGVEVTNLGAEIDGYALNIKSCPYYEGTGNSCSGNSTLLQCQNGSYYVVSTNCRCVNIDYGGN